MLHVYFGTGRLGLGLIAPAFKKTGSELYLFNRAVSGAKPTGGTTISSKRRNELLGEGGATRYFIEKPGGSAADRKRVTYDGFVAYDDENLAVRIKEIVDRSRCAEEGVVVSAQSGNPGRDQQTAAGRANCLAVQAGG